MQHVEWEISWNLPFSATVKRPQSRQNPNLPLVTPPPPPTPPQSSGAARRRAKRLVRSDLPPTRFVWIIQLKPNFSPASQSSSKPEDQRNFLSSRSVNTIVSFFFRLFTVVFSPPPAHRLISASFFEAFPPSRFAPVASLRRRDQTATANLRALLGNLAALKC